VEEHQGVAAHALLVERRQHPGDPIGGAVARTQLAQRVAASMIARGRERGAEMARAMIDPHVVLSAWKDADGRVVLGPVAPDKSAAIFADGSDTVLKLGYDQLRALGLHTLEGGVPARARP
jgi:hypothetical protein